MRNIRLILYFLLFCVIPSQSQINLSGSLSGTLEPGEYIVEDDIQVDILDTLIIQPSARLRFDGHHEFKVYGLLNAIGAEQDSIIFTRLYPTEESKWAGIRILAGPQDTAAFKYCLLEHGTSNKGGAVYCINASINLEKCYIKNNEAFADNGSYGGAIYLEQSTFSITDSRFESNDSHGNVGSGRGGGVYVKLSEGIIDNCDFISNQAYSTAGVGGGGGLYVSWCDPVIKNCNFISNYGCHGGALKTLSAGPHFLNCTFTENFTDAYAAISHEYFDGVMDSCIINNNYSGVAGGALNIFGGANTFNYCEIFNNDCSGLGGAVYIDDWCEVYLNHCLISHNSSDQVAAVFVEGDMYFQLNYVELNNCTISDNTAFPSIYSSSIYIQKNGTCMLKNTIVSYTVNGTAIYFDQDSFSGIEFCNFFGNDDGDFSGTIPFSLGTIVTVNLNHDSCDAYQNIYFDPEYIDHNLGDYHLTVNSPCIDAGDPGFPPDPDDTIVDMGAYYYDQTPQVNDLTIQILESDVILHWSEIPVALSYNIYRSTEPYFEVSILQPIANTTLTEFIDSGVLMSGKYFYIVTCLY